MRTLAHNRMHSPLAPSTSQKVRVASDCRNVSRIRQRMANKAAGRFMTKYLRYQPGAPATGRPRHWRSGLVGIGKECLLDQRHRNAGVEDRQERLLQFVLALADGADAPLIA